MKRFRVMAAALCAAVLLCGFSAVPAYAYADGGEGENYGDPTMTEETTAPVEAQSSLGVEETRLANLLSRIQGAGAVEVMLSLKSGEQVQYQTDTQRQTDSGGTEESLRQEDNTVLYATGSGSQSALVQQVTAPTYQGAIVVCQGADDPAVKLALVQAVASVTGLGADQITVVKMK